MKKSLIFLLVACSAIVPTLARAAFPDRPIRLVVPYPAGGSTDIAARIVAENMSQRLGVPVITENKAGGSGMLGSGYVARSRADGYTILFAGNGIASAPSLKDTPFDLRKDLIPISKVVASQFSILVNPKMGINTLQELLAFARANPKKLQMACSGAMTAAHFALEGFRQKAGLDFVTVQYAGNAPAQVGMLSGEPPAGIDAAFSAKSAVDAGLLKALAVTGAKRSPLMPNVPTVSEAGVPGYEGGFSLVMLVPAGTPPEIVDTISKTVMASVRDKAVVERLQAQGYEPVGNTPAEYAAQLDDEIKQSAQIIASLREAGVTP